MKNTVGHNNLVENIFENVSWILSVDCTFISVVEISLTKTKYVGVHYLDIINIFHWFKKVLVVIF